MIRARRHDLDIHVEESRNQSGEWTGKGLAEMTGHSAGTIRRIERGLPVRSSTIFDILEAIDLDLYIGERV
jgi:ribosome-binding protein aMBF1 (putative translation factor)